MTVYLRQPALLRITRSSAEGPIQLIRTYYPLRIMDRELVDFFIVIKLWISDNPTLTEYTKMKLVAVTWDLQSIVHTRSDASSPAKASSARP